MRGLREGDPHVDFAFFAIILLGGALQAAFGLLRLGCCCGSRRTR
jgi:MFS superfamily sulfate permease-like transporter